MTGPLTRAEWEAVLFQAPAGIQHLVLRLAVHHGVIEVEPETCPLCQSRREPEQLELSRES